MTNVRDKLRKAINAHVFKAKLAEMQIKREPSTLSRKVRKLNAIYAFNIRCQISIASPISTKLNHSGPYILWKRVKIKHVYSGKWIGVK